MHVQSRLAAAVNPRLHADQVLDADADASYIGKLERGVHRWPNRPRRVALQQVLGVGADTDLGFYIVRSQEPAVCVTARATTRPLIANPADTGDAWRSDAGSELRCWTAIHPVPERGFLAAISLGSTLRQRVEPSVSILPLRLAASSAASPCPATPTRP